jgi:hypothetical protein
MTSEQVYDYADDGLIEPTAGIEEDMNDFNDETFGMETVGQSTCWIYLGMIKRCPLPQGAL